MIQIKDNSSFLIFFKEKFSEIEFQLLKGCLSYAYKNDKKLVIHQNLISYLYKASVKTKNLRATIIDNFSQITSLKEVDIIIPIYVLLNPKEKETLLDTWALISSEDGKTIPFTTNGMESGDVIQDIDIIVASFNAEYKKFIAQFKIELEKLAPTNTPHENKPSEIDFLIMRYGPTILDYSLRYGLPAAQAYSAYSAYSTLQSSYRSIGSLQRFLKIPPTKIGKAQALINTYSLLELYRYIKLGINWLSKKFYGK